MKRIFSAPGMLAQPRPLMPLFFIELWERFGFYAVQNVLVLYLTQVFHLSDSDAFSLFGIASAFTFATPFIGGYIADKILGHRNSVLLGAVLLMVGYWLLMFHGLTIFYWAIAFIVIGTGFFKSCISTLVGLLYEESDPRRDAGFTIFYMGINLGGFFGPLMSGYVSTHLGWPFVFGFTGGGLVIAFVTAIFAFRLLGTKGLPPAVHKVQFLGYKISSKHLLILGMIIAISIFAILIKYYYLANIIFRVLCVLCILGIVKLALKCKKRERSNMFALIAFAIFSVTFWAIFAQMYSSVNLFADRMVNRDIAGFTVPTVWFQALEGFFIVLMTPFFVRLWNYVDRRRMWLTSGAAKFSVALLLLAVAFFVWGISVVWSGHGHKVNMAWLALGYCFLTAGELCLSPIGLSLFSELAPARYRGMMMGAWMLSISAGYALGGMLAKLSSVPEALLNQYGLLHLGHYYHHAFLIFMWSSLIAGSVVGLLVPSINKLLMADHHG